MKILAVMDTFWGATRGRAPRFFKINPRNRSGNRLLKLTEGHSLICTDCAPMAVTSPKEYSPHDPQYLAENLTSHKFDLFLICGNKAQATFASIEKSLPHIGRILRIPHPASRNFPKALSEVIHGEINIPHGIREFRMDKKDIVAS